jgi:hypothetical protein
MGPAFVLLLYMIIAAILGFAAGAVLAFVVIPLYKRFRRPNAWLQRRQFIKAYGLVQMLVVLLGTTTAAVASVAALTVGLTLWELQYEDDYWMAAGMYDYWRWPLEYPYQFEAVDDVDDAHLCVWGDGGGTLVAGVTAYRKSGSILIGEFNSGDSEHRYFTFDCTSGAVAYLDDSLFRVELQKLQPGDDGERPELTPVGEQYYRWAQNRDEYAEGRRGKTP